MPAKHGTPEKKQMICVCRRKRVGQPMDIDPDTLGLEIPDHVKGILANLAINQDERKRAELSANLEDTLNRCKKALDSIGERSNLPCTPSEADMILQSLNKPPDWDVKQKKDELKAQQNMLDCINAYIVNLDTKKAIITEVEDWLEASSDLDQGTLSKEEMERISQEYDEIDKSIKESFDFAVGAVGRIDKLGQRLLKDAGYIESDEEDDTPAVERKLLTRLKAQATRDGPKDVVDVTTLMNDSTNVSFYSALGEVKQTLEQSIRLVRNNFAKNFVRQGLKQFRFLMKAIEKRLDTAKEKETELLEIRTKADVQGKTIAKQKRELERLEKNINYADAGMLRMEDRIKKLKEENASLKEKVEVLEDYKDEVEKERLTWKASIVSSESGASFAHVTPTPKRSVVKEFVLSQTHLKVTESMMEAATKSIKDELDRCKQNLINQIRKTEKLDKDLLGSQENEERLKLKLEMFESLPKSEDGSNALAQLLDANVAELKSLKDRNAALNQLVESMSEEVLNLREKEKYQEKKIRELKDELGTLDMKELKTGTTKTGQEIPDKLKRQMIRMKNEFENEMSRLKTHQERERARHEAAIRRIENAHKDHIQAIYKQCLHFIRTINRFKDSVCEILDKEEMGLFSEELQRVGYLQCDESVIDPRIFLVKMSGSTVDLMLNIQHKISQALKSAHMEAKDTSISKLFISKELQQQTEVANQTRQATVLLTERLRESKAKLAITESALINIQKIESEKYSTLLERYRKLVHQYSGLHKDHDKMIHDFGQNLKDKERALKKIASQKEDMKATLADQQGMIRDMHHQIKQRRDEHKKRLKMSIEDHQKNLKTLKEALTENKISKKMFSMCEGLIKESMELPRLKLRSLFERYIAFHRFREFKETINRKLDSKLLESHRVHFERVQAQMDEKLERAKLQWAHEQTALEDSHRRLFQDMYNLIGDVTVETGVLLIPPKSLIATSSTTSVFTHSTSTGTSRSKASTSKDSSQTSGIRLPKLKKLHTIRDEDLTLPDEIVGTRVKKASECIETMWEMPKLDTLPPIQQTSIEVPRIFDLEVNQQLKAAQRALNKIRFRASYPVSYARGFDYSDHEVVPFNPDCASESWRSKDSDKMTQNLESQSDETAQEQVKQEDTDSGLSTQTTFKMILTK